MPITVRTNILKYKKPNDPNYYTVDIVTDQDTQTRIQEIDAEGENQVAAVTERGDYYIDNVIAPTRIKDEDDLGINVVAGTPEATIERIDSVTNNIATETATTVTQEWLSNLNPNTSIIIDNNLNTPGAAADAKVIGDRINNLNSAYNKILTLKHKNLFDINDPRNKSGEYYTTNGSLNTNQSTNYCHTHPIYVTPGTYRHNAFAAFGPNNLAVAIVNESGTKIRVINGSFVEGFTGNYLVDFTIQEECYISINYNSIGNLFIVPVEEYSAYTTFNPAFEHVDINKLTPTYQELYQYISQSKNLFNKYDQRNCNNYYYDIGNWYKYNSNSNNWCSHPILIFPGTYKYPSTGSYGPANSSIIAVVDKDNNVLNYICGSYSNDVITFSVEHICYISVNYDKNKDESFILCSADNWTGIYSPYIPPARLSLAAMHLVGSMGVIETVVGLNLFDKYDTAHWSIDRYFGQGSANRGLLINNKDSKGKTSGYIQLNGAGYYTMPMLHSFYGGASPYINLFNSSYEYSSYCTGTEANIQYHLSYVTIEVTQEQINNGAKFIGLTWYTGQEVSLMCVKGNTYPIQYINHTNTHQIPELDEMLHFAPNPLFKKIALFNGDSICDEINRGAYPALIAAENNMGCFNYAISGATITTINGHNSICDMVDQMYNDYPNADYIILEGGTNDADNIGSIIDGTIPAQFGTFNEEDFSGEYDTNTFCGAVETMLFKAVSYWPHAHIGFVIAQKMGLNIPGFMNRRAYFGKIMEICKKWGIPYLNLWDDSHMNPMLTTYYDSSLPSQTEAGKFYTDGQHLTKYGYEYIAPIISKWMRTL